MLNARRLGIAGGILWGISMFFMTWASILWDYGTPFLELMNTIYPGYEISPIGSVIGIGYGFLDAFIGLFVLAWLYNRIK